VCNFLWWVQVGAALSMVYISGSPVMFVGCGQSYTDLKKLNVKAIVKTLLKWARSSFDECLWSECCSLSVCSWSCCEWLTCCQTSVFVVFFSLLLGWISPSRLYFMLIITILFLRFAVVFNLSQKHAYTCMHSDHRFFFSLPFFFSFYELLTKEFNKYIISIKPVSLRIWKS
jgi:hypothetical protein